MLTQVRDTLSKFHEVMAVPYNPHGSENWNHYAKTHIRIQSGEMISLWEYHGGFG